MTTKQNKGFVTNGKYFNNLSMKPVQLHNDNILNAKETYKEMIKEELMNLSTTSDLTLTLAKIASLTSLYLDLDGKGCQDIPYILFNKKTGHLAITKEDPSENWIEALEWVDTPKTNKTSN